MVVNFLVLFLVAAIAILSIGLTSDKQSAGMSHPVFRKFIVIELFLYLATAFMVLVIAVQIFGPFTHWVLPLFALIAPRFVRMGYPNFLHIWREKEQITATS
jgi:hypothetical protein